MFSVDHYIVTVIQPHEATFVVQLESFNIRCCYLSCCDPISLSHVPPAWSYLKYYLLRLSHGVVVQFYPPTCLVQQSYSLLCGNYSVPPGHGLTPQCHISRSLFYSIQTLSCCSASSTSFVTCAACSNSYLIVQSKLLHQPTTSCHVFSSAELFTKLCSSLFHYFTHQSHVATYPVCLELIGVLHIVHPQFLSCVATCLIQLLDMYLLLWIYKFVFFFFF